MNKPFICGAEDTPSQLFEMYSFMVDSYISLVDSLNKIEESLLECINSIKEIKTSFIEVVTFKDLPLANLNRNKLAIVYKYGIFNNTRIFKSNGNTWIKTNLKKN